MKILLDTHVFLWAISDPASLSKTQRDHIESAANIVYVSAVSVAEIMIKASIGKLQLNFNPNEEILEAGFEMLDFSCRDAIRLGNLPFHHRDPFDRMLICQAIERRLRVATQDPAFQHYDCRLI